MYKIGLTVWAIIYPFDIPKKVEIQSVSDSINNSTSIYYTVKYKNREYTIANCNVFDDYLLAHLFWAIEINSEYEKTLNSDLFFTDEYEIANLKAKKILKKIKDEYPELLLKYL